MMKDLDYTPIVPKKKERKNAPSVHRVKTENAVLSKEQAYQEFLKSVAQTQSKPPKLEDASAINHDGTEKKDSKVKLAVYGNVALCHLTPEIVAVDGGDEQKNSMYYYFIDYDLEIFASVYARPHAVSAQIQTFTEAFENGYSPWISHLADYVRRLQNYGKVKPDVDVIRTLMNSQEPAFDLYQYSNQRPVLNLHHVTAEYSLQDKSAGECHFRYSHIYKCHYPKILIDLVAKQLTVTIDTNAIKANGEVAYIPFDELGANAQKYVSALRELLTNRHHSGGKKPFKQMLQP